jgi:hypothetical protein
MLWIGAPDTTMSLQSRDSCHVYPGLKCGMMGPLAFRIERKLFSFALGIIGLCEVMGERGCHDQRSKFRFQATQPAVSRQPTRE